MVGLNNIDWALDWSGTVGIGLSQERGEHDESGNVPNAPLLLQTCAQSSGPRLPPPEGLYHHGAGVDAPLCDTGTAAASPPRVPTMYTRHITAIDVVINTSFEIRSAVIDWGLGGDALQMCYPEIVASSPDVFVSGGF